MSGRYRVVGAVGAGPLGWVFLVRDLERDAERALKVIRLHLVQTPRERQHLAETLLRSQEVRHSRVVGVLEVGQDAGWPFFTRPFFDGTPLRRILERRLSRGQRFTLEEVEPLLSQLAQALDAAHRERPHGGVKPENVFVLPDGIRLTDFALGPGLPLRPFVQAQRQARADAYLAPELHESPPDARSDVYAFGVVLGELLSGQRPGEGGVPELRRANPALPRAVEGLYRRALSPNPLLRPRTAGELMAELFAAMHPSMSSLPAQRPPLAEEDETSTLSLPPPEGFCTAEPPPQVPDAPLPKRAETRAAKPRFPGPAELPAPLLEPERAPWPGVERRRTEVLETPMSTERGSLVEPLLRWSQAAGAVMRAPPRPFLWLGLLALAGLMAGAAVGLWLLHRLPSAPSLFPLPPEAAPT